MRSTCLTLTDEEYAFVKDSGLSFIAVFRKGLEVYQAQARGEPGLVEEVQPDRTKEPKPVKESPSIYNSYGCGCSRVEGKKLCPKHKVA